MMMARKQSSIVGLVSLAAMTWLMGPVSCLAQPKLRRGALEPNAGPTRLYFGAIVCADCHETPKKSEPEPVLCRCNEFKVWDQQDKHKSAFVALRSERARRMGELLSFKDATTEKSCLGCHGVDIRDPNVKVDKTFKVEEGVTCVACHGAYFDWVDVHGSRLQREKWRALSREQKQKDYGMTDLWNPATRARTCAACHIGDSEQGKVVTHAMYAAGHPPLPGFEVSAFSDAMPRHWQYLHEKKPQVQKLLDHDPDEHERTKLVVIGGVVEFQEAMMLLATQADTQAGANSAENRMLPRNLAISATSPVRSGTGRSSGLDLAQFDCYACHHDLKQPGWRQERGFAGRPGRPSFRQWPLALVKLALYQAGQERRLPEFEKKLGALYTAFDAQPFGRLDEAARAARTLAEWSKELEASLGNKDVRYHQEAALGLLGHLCSLSAAETPDYDTARQIAWAFETIYYELDRKPVNDAAFREKFKALDKELKLALPSGQDHQILTELPQALRTIGEYDPSKFQQILQELAKLLAK
jgi:hypothetical protein